MSSSHIQSIEEFFVHNLKKTIETTSHEDQKRFNRNLASYKLLVFHPYYLDDAYKVLVGFANECDQQGSDQAGSSLVYKQITNHMHFAPTQETYFIEKTLIVQVSDVKPIYVRKVSWEEAINQPKLSDARFSYLEEAFFEFFSLENVKYNKYGLNQKTLSDFFNDDTNKPEGLELRVVWEDIDSNDKYGNVQVLVFWKTEFIGWILRSGRWLEDFNYSTISGEKWSAMMNVIYEQSGYVNTGNLDSVSVYTMNDEPDDLLLITGISRRSYTKDTDEDD